MKQEHLIVFLPISIICVIAFCVWAFIPGRITEGYVVNKRYEPERTYFDAGTKIMMTDDEEWLLTIEGHSPARGLRKEGIRKQTKEVSEETYGSYKIGDWVKF